MTNSKSFRIDPELHKAIKIRAAEEGITMLELIVKALKHYLGLVCILIMSMVGEANAASCSELIEASKSLRSPDTLSHILAVMGIPDAFEVDRTDAKIAVLVYKDQDYTKNSKDYFQRDRVCLVVKIPTKLMNWKGSL